MSKYTPFTEWLKRQPQDNVTLTFDKIEGIINDNLPSCARISFRPWDNVSGTSLCEAWLNAGFQTVMVDMENETVRLKRI